MIDTDSRRASTAPASARRRTELLDPTGDCLALFERWQQDGDQRAREQLIHRFLPLARRLALRYVGANEPVDDLMQVASLALVKAVDRFDISRGLAFSSFAVPTILGELRRYFRDFGWAVHVPRGAQERALRVENVARELAEQSGRTPSVYELAQYLEWDVSDVLDAWEAGVAHHATSLDAPARDDEDGGASVIDTLGADDDRFDFINDRLAVSSVLHILPLKERRVMHLRFVEELTQTEIGKREGVSQMQVSRMLASALTRLRNAAGG